MIDLIPAQYRMAALAALFAISVSVAFGAGWTVNGWRLGKASAEANYSAAASAIETLTARIAAASDRASALQGSLDTAAVAATSARKEIANVLPPDNRNCDLPASARGLFNRASGYPDAMPNLDPTGP